MVPQVVFHESRYEIITVVITCLAAQLQIDFAVRARGLKQLRIQLLLEKLVGKALVNKNLVFRPPLADAVIELLADAPIETIECL